MPENARKCLECGITLPLSDFQNNKLADDWDNKDLICRGCLSTKRTLQDLKQYFWTNNRAFTQELYNAASLKAANDLKSAAPYKRAPADQKAAIEEAYICERIIAMANTAKFYKYEPHAGEYNADEQEAVGSKADTKRYNAVWAGNYTADELATLQNYYDEVLGEVENPSRVVKDYVMKAAKSSLLYDETFDAYRRGEATIDDLKNASALLDAASKTGAIAPSKTGNSANDESSLGELITKLITTGRTCTRKIEYEPDVIDKLLHEYQHIVEAVGDNDGGPV